jgi:hypothetical protein
MNGYVIEKEKRKKRVLIAESNRPDMARLTCACMIVAKPFKAYDITLTLMITG